MHRYAYDQRDEQHRSDREVKDAGQISPEIPPWRKVSTSRQQRRQEKHQHQIGVQA